MLNPKCWELSECGVLFSLLFSAPSVSHTALSFLSYLPSDTCVCGAIVTLGPLQMFLPSQSGHSHVLKEKVLLKICLKIFLTHVSLLQFTLSVCLLSNKLLTIFYYNILSSVISLHTHSPPPNPNQNLSACV